MSGDGDRRGVTAAIGLALAPFVLSFVLLGIVYGVAGRTPIAQLPTAMYALVNLGVAGVLVWTLPRETRRRVMPFRRPTRREIAAAVGVTLLTILVVDPIATAVGEAFGLPDPGPGSLGTVSDIVIYATGAIAVAPVAEELLYRGVALEALQYRFGVGVAIGGSAALFGGIHLLAGGLPGAVAALCAGIAYGWMRIRFDNLTGATIAHVLHNVVLFAGALGVAG